MLPSRSSTPRPRPVLSNTSSFVGYQEEYTSSSEPSWTTPDIVKGSGKDESSAEISLEIRPRKRRRVSSGLVATKSNTDAGRTANSQSLLDYSSRISSSNQVSVPCKDTRSYGLCQTCRKCESNVLCARCETATCSICARTCTLGAVSTPPTPLLCFSATPSPRPMLRRLPDQRSDSLDEIDVDDLRARLAITSNSSPSNKRRSASALSSQESECDDRDGPSRWSDDLPGGCGRVVCQSCAVEDSDSHESTCLDCLDGFGCSSVPSLSPSDPHLRYGQSD
ncbi:hypothetical protein FS749_002333 [Ceratobasidium sp. UAMH 11750]|nr:hypothetical protein FS749_002333 [Ceratobasidium sp. UAMH 11750]